ncbi:MAG: PspC domain-containing protein [Nocardiopsis sp. BM-2018]|uniref:Phage shock protein PspC (Stress-responsive transcriptional regulator) n=1 Tax=Nocardiopsis metallicus TaxID=179819 RepID=A0A840WR75_9ACTN|nr:PspC domain-containing protein [Nocardiopsis metallicus]MBB5494375.1 phage shock protein PspC (stress-responsive transcriptional regulator) [Nocardiopsis metallicus]QRN81412.1 MAG: PspC domain-containing protein [Nocardiopsis sp. BM-2018]
MNENFGGKRLQRSESDRFLTGVCGGIAAYTGIDSTIVRIIFVILVLLGMAGIPIYILAWLLMPAESEQRSLLEQIIRNFQGKPSEH